MPEISSNVKIAAVLIVIAVIGFIFTYQLVTGNVIISLPGTPSPKGLQVVGTITATPSVTKNGKVFTVTLHAVGEGVVGYAYVQGAEGETKVDIFQRVNSGSQTLTVKYPWRAGSKYTLILYSDDMKKVGETTVETPFTNPLLEASRVEINYGLVPSLQGTQLFIYGYAEYTASDIDRLGVLLVASSNIITSPKEKTFIVLETGAAMMSKVDRFRTVNNIAGWLKAYGLYADVKTALTAASPSTPEKTVFIFLDTIPYEFKNSLPQLLSQGAIAIVVSPWLGKYWFKGGVLWVDPSPHPEQQIVGTTFDVFEETSVETQLNFLFYNETMRTRQVKINAPSLGEIYLFKVGRGYVVWIPATCGEVPDIDWLITQIAATGAWNLYHAIQGEGSYSVSIVNLNYDYVITSLFVTTLIREGTVNVYMVLMGANGGYLCSSKTLYIPQLIKK